MKTAHTVAAWLLGICITLPAYAAERVALRPVRGATIDDPFWSPKLGVWRSVSVNDCFDKFERDGALANFDHVARGALNAEHGGPPWYDGLVYEMIRGAADLLAQRPDPALKARIDAYVNRIAAAAARDPDGYINTYTTMKEPNHRWGMNGGNDRFQHDLYNIGCLVEAGVHYYRATGETKLLATAVRAANGMVKVMGPSPKQNIIPGHALSEESFVRLYELFQEQPELRDRLGAPVEPDDYLALAKFWIDARGHHAGRETFGAYNQDHIPFLQQRTIEGHAVRAALLGAGATAYGIVGHEPQYIDAADALWQNMTTRRLYVTGGVGAIADDEKFGGDFVLPNNGYLETCAAVANSIFSQNLFQATGDGTKYDEFERALYNGALAGVSLQGDTYFYENPLEAGPNRARWSWHPCPCCPPMFLKLMGALPDSIYAADAENLYVNLFISSTAQVELADGASPVAIQQTTQYPWDGRVQLTVSPGKATEFALRVRVPEWLRGGDMNDGLYATSPGAADALRLTINKEEVAKPEIERGYVVLRRAWKSGDVVEVQMAMPVHRVSASERVEADRGRVALMRGPLVYCLESFDNDGRLRDLYLPNDAEITPAWRGDLLGGVTVLTAKAKRLALDEAQATDAELTAIPFFANSNRGPTEMLVWLPANAERAVRPTIAGLAKVSASHCFASDSVAALHDGLLPKDSSDSSIPRFTWWDHRGGEEWAQYDFDQLRTVDSVSVYWWDDSRQGRDCAAPANWRLLYQTPGGDWTPVTAHGGYGTALDSWNKLEFEPVATSALRIEATLPPNRSSGILEWQVASPK